MAGPAVVLTVHSRERGATPDRPARPVNAKSLGGELSSVFRMSDEHPPATDAAARDAVLRQHLGLVYHVAQQLARPRANDVELDDLVSAGTIGLIEAFENFDATRGLAFSTFAAPRIRGAILDELRRLDRVPRSVRRKTRQIDGAMTALARSLGRPPANAELAEGLGIDLATLWRWQTERESTQVVSLDRSPGGAAHGAGAGEWLAGSTGDEIDDSITLTQEAERVRDALLDLPEQERRVLSLHYFEELKLNDVARILDVSESRVSQIRSKGLNRLRRRLASLRTPAA